MDALQNILTRRSIREYDDRPVSKEDMDAIVKAALSGPTCADTRDWAFIVVTDKEKLKKMAEANGRYAYPLTEAAFGVLICGNTDKAFPPAKDYWVIDGAIAGQNMILAARALGIGSVWLGTWPQMERVKRQAELFELPENLIPHSLIAFGYSEKCEDVSEKALDYSAVYYEKI